jgi:hypothetical protein
MARACGVDCGTMFFQVAENDEKGKAKIQIVRNAFVEIAETEGIDEILSQNNWSYIKDGKSFYIPGEDAIRFARMFPGRVELRRPLADGVLNKGEDKKTLVLDKIIQDTVGKATDGKSVICTCISSPSVDGGSDSKFHKGRLEAMFKSKGWVVKVIEEGYAVIIAENPKAIEVMPDGRKVEQDFSGIGISFGAGRVNCVVSWKKMPIVAMSATRSGDWIDQRVAEETGVPLAQVTNIKETKLDFNNIDDNDDVQFALDAYYGAMLEYVFTKFADKFKQEKGEHPFPLDVIVAGGTSMPKGFVDKVEAVIRGLELPFKVKDVRHAADPRNAVVEGCLAVAISAADKLAKAPTATTSALDNILG